MRPEKRGQKSARRELDGHEQLTSPPAVVKRRRLWRVGKRDAIKGPDETKKYLWILQRLKTVCDFDEWFAPLYEQQRRGKTTLEDFSQF
jgi:hypothetical protein